MEINIFLFVILQQYTVHVIFEILSTEKKSHHMNNNLTGCSTKHCRNHSHHSSHELPTLSLLMHFTRLKQGKDCTFSPGQTFQHPSHSPQCTPSSHICVDATSANYSFDGRKLTVKNVKHYFCIYKKRTVGFQILIFKIKTV